ncbi:uncharacterized protein LOC134261495 [Saccostrea cucullata]|uniref:uncharacterized protein LOC134261495 n=1 Tax=Saccostrea cuccullata TaxID=36930 RepID=UPI002ECFEBE3
MSVENVLSAEIDKKGNLLVVTIRNDMYSKVVSELEFKIDFIKKALVDISDSSNKLTREEMKQIYDLYVDIPFQTDELHKTFSCIPPLGFPQSCKLFGNDKILQKKGLNFFQNPTECLKKYVNGMFRCSKLQFSVLVYILMNNGSVANSSLRNNNVDREKKIKAMEVCLKTKDSPKLWKFTQCIDGLIDSFLVAEQNFCKFSHSCIQNVVKNTLMENDIPFVIENCHMSLLINLHVQGTEEMETNLQAIDQSFFAYIYNRIIECLKCNTKSELLKIISCFQLWKDESFCIGFQDFMDEEKYLLTKVDENYASLLVYFSEAGQIKMVKFLLNIITDNNQKYKALNQATLMNHENIVQILLDSGISPDAKICFCAIQNGNLDIVKQFITAGLDLLEISESRHPFYEGSVSLLVEACLWEKLELIFSLLKQCPDLCNVKTSIEEPAPHILAYAGATDALKFVIEECKYNPFLKTKKGVSILHYACLNGKLETAKYIISNYPDLLREEHDLIDDGSILHTVAAGGNVDLFQILKNKTPTISSETGQTV